MECKIFLCSLVVYKLGGVFENRNYLGQKQNDVTFYFHRTAKILRILEIILVEWYDYKNRRGGQGRRQCLKPSRGAWGDTPSQFSRSLTCTSTSFFRHQLANSVLIMYHRDFKQSRKKFQILSKGTNLGDIVRDIVAIHKDEMPSR